MVIMDVFNQIFYPTGLEPHNVHFYDSPILMWTIILGNILVALAYILIPIAIIYFVKKRKDLVFHWVFVFFGLFIFSCGLSHIMHIIVFWYPLYWLQAIVDMLTGIVSLATAISLVPVIPLALKIPSPAQLKETNIKLNEEVKSRQKAESEARKLNHELESRVQLRTQELEEINKELKEMEIRKDQFINMVSHELKTPLTAIKFYVQAMNRKFLKSGEKELTSPLLKLDLQVDKLNRLIHDLLDLPNSTNFRIKLNTVSFDMNELINETIAYIRAINSNKIEIQGKVKRQIQADPYRIEQVITNLLLNAVKYSPKTKPIFLTISTEKDHLKIAIKDFGIGIPKKFQTKIFNRYFRVLEEDDKNFPGMGLGLFISSQIIKSHGGEIWVKSQKNHGSTFYFTLPFGKDKNHESN